MTNLNLFEIPTDCSQTEPLRDYSLTSGNVEVALRGLEDRLVREIQSADIVLGCVAWLTNKRILRALSRVECCLMVQKEDFLRPDSDGSKTELQALYELLAVRHDRWEFWPPLGEMTTCGDPTIEGIRCVGNHNRDKSSAFPRAHHKFVVFGKKREVPLWVEGQEGPPGEVRHEDVLRGCSLDDLFLFDRVWTGSFNFTQNAGHSLENALIVRDERVARAYLGEFAQVAALSEPLNWDDEWCTPEWRLGT